LSELTHVPRPDLVVLKGLDGGAGEMVVCVDGNAGGGAAH
jgi:hypothetical protein